MTKLIYPAVPKSIPLLLRTVLEEGSRAYEKLTMKKRKEFDKIAKGTGLTGYNLFMRKFIRKKIISLGSREVK